MRKLLSLVCVAVTLAHSWAALMPTEHRASVFDWLDQDVLRKIIYSLLSADIASMTVLPLVNQKFNRECNLDAIMSAPNEVFDKLMCKFVEACEDLTLPSWSKQVRFIVRLLNEATSVHGQDEDTLDSLFPLLFYGRMRGGPGSGMHQLHTILSGSGEYKSLGDHWKRKLLLRSFRNGHKEDCIPSLKIDNLDRFSELSIEVARLATSSANIWNDFKSFYFDLQSLLLEAVGCFPNDSGKAVRTVIAVGPDFVMSEMLDFVRQTRPDFLPTFVFECIRLSECVDPEKKRRLKRSALQRLGEEYKVLLDVADKDALTILDCVCKSTAYVTENMWSHLVRKDEEVLSAAIVCVSLTDRPFSEALCKLCRKYRISVYPIIEDVIMGTGIVKVVGLTENERIEMIRKQDLFYEFVKEHLRREGHSSLWSEAIQYCQSIVPEESLKRLSIEEWLIIDEHLLKDRDDEFHPIFVSLIESESPDNLIKALLFNSSIRMKCSNRTLVLFWRQVSANMKIQKEDIAWMEQIIHDDREEEAFESLLVFLFGTRTDPVPEYITQVFRKVFHLSTIQHYSSMRALLKFTLKNEHTDIITHFNCKDYFGTDYIVVDFFSSHVSDTADTMALTRLFEFLEEVYGTGVPLVMLLQMLLFRMIENDRLKVSAAILARYGDSLTPEALLQTIKRTLCPEWHSQPALRLKVIRYVKNMH